MKEATGELNMTVIVAISIGILAAFFFGWLWPMMNYNFKSTSQCNKAYCDCSKSARENASKAGKRGSCECRASENDEDGDIFYCPFKG